MMYIPIESLYLILVLSLINLVAFIYGAMIAMSKGEFPSKDEEFAIFKKQEKLFIITVIINFCILLTVIYAIKGIE